MRFSIALGFVSKTVIAKGAFNTLYAMGLPMFPTPMNPTVTAIGPSLEAASITPKNAGQPEAQRVLTILSHISAYCCRYWGQIFSSAILRKEATSA